MPLHNLDLDSNPIIPQNSEKSTGNEKFSLSQKNIAPIKHGNYNVYGKDITLGIAPIREDISQKILLQKKESTQTSESTSPINADYRVDASDSIISQNSEKSRGNEKDALFKNRLPI